MANLGTIFAHVVKFVITVACMQFFNGSFSLHAQKNVWAVRAFQILLVHSVLGVVRFGSRNTTKRFRNFYEWLSSLTEIVPFVFFTSEVLIRYKVAEGMRIFLLTIGLLPPIVESMSLMRNREKYSLSVDVVVVMQSVAVASLCLQNDEAYGNIALAVSYIVARFISQDFCDRYDVPYTDLSQYSLCFVEIFAMTVLKEF